MKNHFQTIFVFPISIILFLSFTLKIGASDEVETYVSELRHRKNIHEDTTEKDAKNLLGEQRQDVIISNPSESFQLTDFSPEILGMIWQKLSASDRISFSCVCNLFQKIALNDSDYKSTKSIALTYKILKEVYGDRRSVNLLSGLNDHQLGGIYFGFLAPSIELGMFFRYGAEYALPYTIFSILSIVTSQTPIHMSRWGSFYLETDKLLASYVGIDEIGIAQVAHAFVNHTYPMVSLVFWANIGSLINTESAPYPALGTLFQGLVTFLPSPYLALSNLCKGIEVDECLLRRIAQGQPILPDSSGSTVGAYALTALAALSKGMAIKNITDSHLEKTGAHEDARFWSSWGMGGLSAMLTLGFESDKLLKWGKQVINNPTSTLFASAQAPAVMSIYWGITTMDPWMAASILSLEIATETLSIQHHMKSYITPAISRFRESFNC